MGRQPPRLSRSERSSTGFVLTAGNQPRARTRPRRPRSWYWFFAYHWL